MPNNVKPIYVYGLIDPTDNKIKYIGQTRNVIKRWSEHYGDIPFNKKGDWIRKLKSRGIRPYLIVLKTVRFPDRHKAENYYIKEFQETILNTRLIEVNKFKSSPDIYVGANLKGAKK